MNQRTAFGWIPYLLCFGMLVGCVKHKDRSGLLTGVPTKNVKLENRHTLAPNLSITIPQGFEVEWVKEAQYDKFYITDPNDNSEIQHGMLIVDVTPRPIRIIRDTSTHESSRGTIAGFDADWREALAGETPAERVHQREMIQPEVLLHYQAGKGAGSLQLYAFVVGSDSLLVERLTAAAETITLLPPKENL